MQYPQRRNTTISWTRLRHVSWAGATLAFLAGACTDDPIVYPNRNTPPNAGGATTTEGGALGDAGEATGGTSGRGGSGGAAGKSMGGSHAGMKADVGGAAGATGGPVCGNHKVEPPEECDDGNTDSGDGCSEQCKSSCEACEMNVCPIYVPMDVLGLSPFDACYKAKGTIETGPAANVPRSDICRALVDCVRREECAQPKGYLLKTPRCWCDKDFNAPGSAIQCTLAPDPNNPTDPARYVPGKCAQEFKDASEGDTAANVVASLAATSKAEGAANRLIANCDTRVCTEECVPAYFKHGTAAMISASIVALRNSDGESALGDLIADSQRAIARTDFAFVLPQFIAQSEGVDLLMSPTPNRAADAVGRVLWSEARAVHIGYVASDAYGAPESVVDDGLYSVTFTGQQIRDALTQQLGMAFQEGGAMPKLYVSGLRYTWKATPTEATIVDVSKSDGTALDNAATYTVAIGPTLIGSMGPLPALGNRIDKATLLADVDVSELLGEYMSQLPQPVSPPELKRIKRLN